MSTNDPEVKDASTPNQLELQGQLNPFFGGLINQPQNSMFGGAWRGYRPEADAYAALAPGLLELFNQGRGPATSFFEAYQPIYQNNLKFGLGQLGAAAPLAGSSALATQGIDFGQQQLNAFNLFAEQAQQNFFKTALEAAGQLGTLGTQAGTAYGQRYVNPIVELLRVASQYAMPRSEVYQPPSGFDYANQAAQSAAAIYTAANSGKD